tara:strand:+ start:25 stop:264 length:240 start_codon:yes stop_codon:yes gene_type:complete
MFMHHLTDKLKRRIKQMDIVLSNYQAIGIAEGFIPCDDEDRYYAAWQHIIDNGLHRSLQGWYGRTAKVLIESGLCRDPE